MTKTIYLANPYGFSEGQKSGPLQEIKQKLESMGAEVWEPFERNNQVDFSDGDWAYKVGQADLNDVINCDGIVAVVNGMPPDDGVAIEVGAGIALGKPIFLFRDDFRSCCDSGKYPLNLMWFTGHRLNNWQDYYYTSVKELSDPNKQLAKWLGKTQTKKYIVKADLVITKDMIIEAKSESEAEDIVCNMKNCLGCCRAEEIDKK
jgi:nucleoside 2-deoxyribosyltransferase